MQTRVRERVEARENSVREKVENVSRKRGEKSRKHHFFGESKTDKTNCVLFKRSWIN